MSKPHKKVLKWFDSNRSQFYKLNILCSLCFIGNQLLYFFCRQVYIRRLAQTDPTLAKCISKFDILYNAFIAFKLHFYLLNFTIQCSNTFQSILIKIKTNKKKKIYIEK